MLLSHADALWLQVPVEQTPSPQWRYNGQVAAELFMLQPDFPLGAVDTYPDPDVVPDAFAYGLEVKQGPVETFDIPGGVHTRYVDATAPSDIGLGVQHLQAPLPLLANVANYGIG